MNRTAIRILAFVGVIGLCLFASSTQASVPAGPRCDCVYTSGSYGVIINNDCKLVDCWRPIE